jgi:hypothetical protein
VPYLEYSYLFLVPKLELFIMAHATFS